MNEGMTPETAYLEIYGVAEHNLYVQLFFFLKSLLSLCICK